MRNKHPRHCQCHHCMLRRKQQRIFTGRKMAEQGKVKPGRANVARAIEMFKP